MGSALALLSSLVWGVADFLGGELSKRRAAVAVAGGSQIVGLLAMLVVLLVTGEYAQAIPWTEYAPFAVAASVAGLTGLVAFYTALSTGRMGIVSPITALGVMVPLTYGLVRGEQPEPWQYVGIVVAVVGVVLASGPEVTGGSGLRPVLLALLAALAFGTFSVLLAEGSKASPILTMSVQRATSVAIVLVIAVVARSIGGLQREDGGRVIAIGVGDVSANLLFGIATTLGLLSVISVLGSLYPVVTAVLAWIILKERLMAAQYVGVGLAVLGVVLISAG